MPVHLEAPYAVAAANSITARVKQGNHTSNMPDDLKQTYNNFTTATEQLEKCRAELDNPKASTYDNGLDRAVSAPSYIARSIVDAYEGTPVKLTAKQQERYDDARLLHQTLYASGIRALTQVNYVEEWEAVNNLRERASKEPKIAAAIERLAMQPEFELINTLHQHFGETIGITSGKTENKTNQALGEWHKAYEDLMVVAAYHGRQDKTWRELVEQPYQEQVTQQAEARARRRTKRTPAKTTPVDNPS